MNVEVDVFLFLKTNLLKTGYFKLVKYWTIDFGRCRGWVVFRQHDMLLLTDLSLAAVSDFHFFFALSEWEHVPSWKRNGPFLESV